MTRFIAVIAASPSGVIGRDGDMPWRLSSDLRRFKRVTLGAPIVMGRKTFDSIGRPLPGRRNLVLTRHARPVEHGGARQHTGVEFLTSTDEVSAATGDAETVYVIGGATIYGAMLPLCDSVYLTRVWTQTRGDTAVPLDLSTFRCVHTERHPQTLRDSMPTEFQIWQRTQVPA